MGGAAPPFWHTPPMRAATVRRILLSVGGAAVLFYLVGRAGTATLASYLANLGVAVLLPILLVGVQHGLRSLCWHAAVRATGHPVPYSHLLRARLGAEALGYLSLTGALGSQTSKVWLLREGVPMAAGAAAVVVDAMAAAIAGVLFTGVALLLSQWLLGLPAWLAAIGGGLVALATAAWLLAAIWSGARRHRDDDLDAILTAPSPADWRAAIRDGLRRASAGLVRLRGQPFARIIVIHCLGHLALFGATWSIVELLGIATGPAAGLFFEVGAKLGNVMGALIPARLGMFEAGFAAAADVAEVASAGGVAVGLVRRCVDLVWVGTGWAILSFAAPSGAARAEAGPEEPGLPA